MSIRQINQSHRYSNVKYIVKSHNMFGIYHRMRFSCVYNRVKQVPVPGVPGIMQEEFGRYYILCFRLSGFILVSHISTICTMSEDFA